MKGFHVTTSGLIYIALGDIQIHGATKKKITESDLKFEINGKFILSIQQMSVGHSENLEDTQGETVSVFPCHVYARSGRHEGN